jgi:hypothetical protein
MLRRAVSVGLAATLAAWTGSFVLAGESDDKGAKKDECKRQFVGVANCKLCHKDPETGDQFGQWSKTRHASALKTLSTPKAKEFAAKAGVENPAKDPKCLKCHVTGIACPPNMRAKTWKESDGVGCESCHGAGKDYAKDDIMKDQKGSIEKGMVMPTEKVCTGCHNQESPTWTGKFDFKEMAAKIAHPNPKKAK